MKTSETKRIIEALANGIDPMTGEIYPKDSPYNHPEVIRTLFFIQNNLKKLNIRKRMTIAERQGENIENGCPRNYGLPWDEALKKEVAVSFKGGSNVNQMAGKLERTRGSIISELRKQGLITAEEAMKL
ncbi:hypothetical protein ACFL57_02775 [Candidatus Margulisiibacteriota bacterium]